MRLLVELLDLGVVCRRRSTTSTPASSPFIPPLPRPPGTLPAPPARGQGKPGEGGVGGGLAPLRTGPGAAADGPGGPTAAQICDLCKWGANNEAQVTADTMVEMLGSTETGELESLLRLVDVCLVELGVSFGEVLEKANFIKRFVAAMKAATGKRKQRGWTEVVDRALRYTAKWADHFSSSQQELPEFQQLYRYFRGNEGFGYEGTLVREGCAAPPEAESFKEVKENLKLLRELNSTNKTSIANGAAFRANKALNSGLTHDLCKACYQIRPLLQELVFKGLSGRGGERTAFNLGELMAILDEIDDLLPKCGWKQGIPKRSLEIRRNSAFHIEGGEKSRVKRRASTVDDCWLEDPEVVADMLEQLTGMVKLQTCDPPRPGKALLVLDLDLTLADFTPCTLPNGSFDVEDPEEIKRPFVEQFLGELYEHYDLCIWSKTGWNALESKLEQLDWLDHPDFGFVLILDKELMLEIAVCKKSSSGPCMTSCKPLKVIWENLGDFYGPHNTVHVDDTPINFMVNMNHGLTCTAWEAQLLSDEVDEDDELHRMKLYLLDILKEEDYAKLDHRQWRRRIKDLT